MDPANSPARLESLLAKVMSLGASDLHLASAQAPYFRIHGALKILDPKDILSIAELRRIADILIADRDRARLEDSGSIDGAFTSEFPGSEKQRFRFNIFRTQGNLSIAIRHLEDRVRDLEELGLPSSLYELCSYSNGLVVVAGPTGSGKSTTLAALIDRINQTREGHIVTIEDPIEILHSPRQCLVNQREIGRDASSFDEALVASLRQDPDFILVGEIRDRNTIRTAITASETGHLVFTTVHASDCVGAIERLIAVFRPGEQEGVRQLLSFVLKAIISQHLIAADGDSIGPVRQRVVVSEILRVTPAVANLIAHAKGPQIYSSMETGSALGMQTLDADLARLWARGLISETSALTLARNPTILRDRRQRIAPITVRRRGPGANP